MEEKALTKKGRFLAIYEVLAGVVGLVMTGITFLRVGASGGFTGYLYGTILVVASIFSVAAGIMLLQKKPGGMMASFVLQLVQVPVLLLQGFYYQFFLLISLSIGQDAARAWILRWGAGVHVGCELNDRAFDYAGVNLVAITLLLLIPGALKNKS